MLLPLSLICDPKKSRRDGTSIIFIQYCFTLEKRTLLNTGIAIRPKFWNKKMQAIDQRLPASYGDADALSRQLKTKLRLAEDLVELAAKKGIKNPGKLLMQAFQLRLDPNALEGDEI